MNYNQLNDNYQNLISESICELISLFKTSPHIFLTEEDLRCVLFQILSSKFGFAVCSNGSFLSPVHAEVRWYGKDNNQHQRSDIVILDTNDLSVDKNGRFPLPSKGYGFNNFYGAVEIKLRRINGETDDEWINKLKIDINKLNSLKTAIVNKYEPSLLLIAFDKKQNIATKIPTSDSVQVVYESMKI